MAEPRRILIVRLSHLGDVVHSLPVFHALRSAHPQATIAWAVQTEFADLLEGLPGLDRVIRFSRRGGAGAWTRLRREVLEFAPDWTVDAQGNTKSALVTLSSQAARRSGLAPQDWAEAFGAHVLTDSAPACSEAHALERQIGLARALVPGAALRTDPDLTPPERQLGERTFREWFGGDVRNALILNLSDPEDVRSWPIEHVKTLVHGLAKERTPTLLLSGPNLSEVASRLESELAGLNARHVIAQKGLRLLAGFFQAAAGRGCRMLSSDSGPMHLAVACGLPVLALAGPQDARRTGPWPRSEHMLLTADDPPECAPCLSRTCGHRSGPVCMSRLLPEAVLARLG